MILKIVKYLVILKIKSMDYADMRRYPYEVMKDEIDELIFLNHLKRKYPKIFKVGKGGIRG
jgi:hypothetical protein